MTTLKELVMMQPLTGASDITVIKQWFIANHKQSEGIEVISELSVSKLKEVELIVANARTWIPLLPDMYESNKGKIDKNVAKKLTTLTHTFLLKMTPDDALLDWARENIPMMKTPLVIFVPMVDWLRKEYGITFKDGKGEFK